MDNSNTCARGWKGSEEHCCCRAEEKGKIEGGTFTRGEREGGARRLPVGVGDEVRAQAGSEVAVPCTVGRGPEGRHNGS
jgi:hypothetical protein